MLDSASSNLYNAVRTVSMVAHVFAIRGGETEKNFRGQKSFSTLKIFLSGLILSDVAQPHFFHN